MVQIHFCPPGKFRIKNNRIRTISQSILSGSYTGLVSALISEVSIAEVQGDYCQNDCELYISV